MAFVPATITGRFACVVKIVAPFLLTSTMMFAPAGAVPTQAETVETVTAELKRNRAAPGATTTVPDRVNVAGPESPAAVFTASATGSEAEA